jgi:hypothetical protein
MRQRALTTAAKTSGPGRLGRAGCSEAHAQVVGRGTRSLGLSTRPERVSYPISGEKVDMPPVDVKSDFGIKFIPRTKTLIAYGAGRQEQIKMEVVKSQRLHAEYKE